MAYGSVMKFSVLASGSRANCAYVEAGGERFLIDCGLSARRVSDSLDQFGISSESIGHILITHEHQDHVRGLRVFGRRFGTPIYGTAGTLGELDYPGPMISVVSGKEFRIGAVQVEACSIAHDAVDPVGYIIRADGVTFVYLTDLGRVTPLVQAAVQRAHALVLESNHDEDLLWSCNYPWELKRRISSAFGHLSNEHCAQLLADYGHEELSHIVLAHLSENSNNPAKALETLGNYLPTKHFEICVCAERYQATPLFEVNAPARGQLGAAA